MRRAVLVNGISARSGGGQDIFESFLAELLVDQHAKHRFVVIGGRNRPLGPVRTDNVEIVDVPTVLRRRAALPLYYAIYLPRLLRAHAVDAILNFADLVVPTTVHQIYFFDWSYLIHPDSPAWGKMRPLEYLARRAKLYSIRRMIRYPELTLAQTELMAKRLRALPGIGRVEVVPSAVSASRFTGGADHDFCLPASRIKLLCLANYAPHKNIDLIAPLARLIKSSGVKMTVVTTLGTEDANKLGRLFHAAGLDGAADCVVNVGSVDPAWVPALYRQCDALFLPTLLESFGLPFYEAMYLERTIITSDLDFARDACGDAAFYFDPFSAESALHAVVDAFADEPRRLGKLRQGKERVLSMPDWPGVYRALMAHIDEVCDGSGDATE